ncbi:hypothetical protein VPH35_058327 [Triticum aestivum]
MSPIHICLLIPLWGSNNQPPTTASRCPAMKAMFCSKSQRLPTIASDCDDGPLSSFALLFLLICKSGGRRRMSLLQQSDLLGKPQSCEEPVSGGAGEPFGAIFPNIFDSDVVRQVKLTADRLASALKARLSFEPS